ncbi:hypothetical protein SMACR_07293 [Sordaria macrospora]|uniref:WGS project CABT00000000 data, contig 2.44 n=2 Tax=Sordaria macrospora TaxID=5147 RepID=F7W8D9_SORMK|nr:uncharacterized protein SMAC_07293 [Sordaria macrospora k-hell]KAA8630330.1 hypothetical protein SMACR_07293 [Sordaria macrospora]WPJ62671.1 hypothetical protein SMAC4_07293 [Sordaria macrospora]CCC13784.1 unnamed protein product [Sordaria macrospora k-hell]
MSRPPPLPHPTTTLHLYRHLLRESSYLPVLIRPFFDERITTRFRSHRCDPGPSSCPQTASRLKRAHHDLRYLRAANAGDLPRMRRILLLAFGRTGAKRRQLLTDLLQPDTPTSDLELQKYIAKARAIAKEGRKPDWLDNWDTEKLKAFVRSQVGDAPPVINQPRTQITNLQLTPERAVPKENIWGGELNIKVRRTKLKNKYKQVAEKVLPPVPREEWELLRDLVNKKEEWEVPARRSVGVSVWGKEKEAEEEKAMDWDWKRYATQAIWKVDRQKSRKNMLLSGQTEEDLPMGEQRAIDCHRYTPRLWRRTLEQIWRMTAVMERKKDGKGWEIEWGMKKYEPPVVPAADSEFFEGAPVRVDPRKKGKKGKAEKQ